MFEAEIVQALTIVGGVGGLAGFIGGYLGSADNLFGTFLMGIIGGISLSAIFRIANFPHIYGIGDNFSIVWGAVGGLLLGFVVARSN